MSSINQEGRFAKHRERWLNRISKEKRKAEHFEMGIHSVLDNFDDGNPTLNEIREKLLLLIKSEPD